jgi:hypothetical protein
MPVPDAYVSGHLGKVVVLQAFQVSGSTKKVSERVRRKVEEAASSVARWV